MTAYYNEIDPYCGQWLRNLSAAGHIAQGIVDEQSIKGIGAVDLSQYDQCHFFAGIAGWSRALRLAGWPDDRSVWTGSCPCQPFSAAGKKKGTADERHLWPDWCRLIKKWRPSVIFGEQVDAAIGHGWLDSVFDDLESAGYACASIILPACSVGAPHLRKRLWFVAYRNDKGLEERTKQSAREKFATSERSDNANGLAYTEKCGSGAFNGEPKTCDGQEIAIRGHSISSELADASSQRRQQIPRSTPSYENTYGREGWHEREADGNNLFNGDVQSNTATVVLSYSNRSISGGSPTAPARHGDSAKPTSFWSDVEWLQCRDGKARPTKSGIFPLASRVPNRVDILRAAGNSIVPQVAAEVIKAFMEITA